MFVLFCLLFHCNIFLQKSVLTNANVPIYPRCPLMSLPLTEHLRVNSQNTKPKEYMSARLISSKLLILIVSSRISGAMYLWSIKSLNPTNVYLPPSRKPWRTRCWNGHRVPRTEATLTCRKTKQKTAEPRHASNTLNFIFCSVKFGW